MALRAGRPTALLTRLLQQRRPGQGATTASAQAIYRGCGSALPPKPVTSVLNGTFPQFLAKDNITLTKEEADSFNRWSIFPRVFMLQIPTGAIYAWSMWSIPMTKNLGVLAPAALDWSLGAVGTTFSCLALGFGSSNALLSPWMERAGPRYAGIVAGSLFGGGHILAAAGLYTQTLPLVYLGWGIMGGLGWGLGYISPISSVMKWFPDRKGLATGLSMAAFASGGLIAAPMIEELRRFFFKPPTFAGAVGDVEQKMEAGKQFVKIGGEWSEAVLAKAADLTNTPMPADLAAKMSEGFYLVGTGDTGCAMALVSLGCLYGSSMVLGGLSMRAPPDGWTPKGWTSPATIATSSATPTIPSVSASMAMRTPQFYLMWLTMGGACSSGIAVITSAKLMMGEIFASVNPTIVTPAFTTAFVSALSVANAGGRLGFAAASDASGRKRTLFACIGIAAPACLLVPQLTQLAVDGSMGATPLYMFYGTTFSIICCYAGVLAVVPPFVSETFGPKHSAAIYGRLMTGWSATAILTPQMLAYLRGQSNRHAIDEMVAKASPEAFQEAFKAPVSDLNALIDAKTVTIARLMEIVPQGTQDPSPFLYDSTFYSVSGILAAAAVSNALIRKVDPKYLEEPIVDNQKGKEGIVDDEKVGEQCGTTSKTESPKIACA